MNAQEMLNKAVKIIARQDVDRDLLLFMMNTARRAVLRDRDITKFYTRLTMSAWPGTIDLAAQGVKAVKLVEYNDTPLIKLDSYEAARKIYSDMAATGDPLHYYELGINLMLLPVPTTGTVALLAEVWPADLTDSALSTDIMTAEIPEAWVYLAAAEYLDYGDEPDKGQYWRQKGTMLIEQYMAELVRQYSYGITPAVQGYHHDFSGRRDYNV